MNFAEKKHNWHRNLQTRHLTLKSLVFLHRRSKTMSHVTSSRGKEDITLSGIPWAIQGTMFHWFRVNTAVANRRRKTINFEDIFPKTRKPKSKVVVINRYTPWKITIMWPTVSISPDQVQFSHLMLKTRYDT